MSKHMMLAAQVQERTLRMAALQAAKNRYEKRFIVLAEFWWEVVRKITWKKSFRSQIEISSGYATVDGGNGHSACGVNYGALNTAFWNAASIPRGAHMPVAMVDEHLKKVFLYFDVNATEAIDYRDLLAALAIFQVDILEPAYKLVRAWYRAYDADATGGVSIPTLKAMVSTAACGDAASSAVDRMVTRVAARLVRTTQERRTTEKSINDKLAAYADAARLSKRFGPDYVSKVIPASQMPPPMLDPVWSPYDAALSLQERMAELVHIDVIVEWLAEDQEFRDLLQTQRVAASHPTARQKYEDHVRSKSIDTALERIEREKGPAAQSHHRAVQGMRILTAWRDYLSRNKAIRMNIETFQRQRCVRDWNRYSISRREWRRKVQSGHEFFCKHVVQRMFGYWKHFRVVELGKTAVGMRRAIAYHRANVSQTAFDVLREQAQFKKAVKQHARRLCMRYFLTWAAVYGRGEPVNKLLDTAVVHVKKSAVATTVKDILTDVERDEAERQLQEALRERDAEYKEYLREAEQDAERERWEAAQRQAEKRQKEKRMLQKQAEDQKKQLKTHRETIKQAFQDEWAAKIEAAMRHEKSHQQHWLQKTKPGRATLKDRTQHLILAVELEEVTQECSDFEAYINMDDGCIHFFRKADPERGLSGLDLNIDSLTLKETALIAAAHFVAQRAVEVRDRMLEEKTVAWAKLERDLAATAIQKAFRARIARLQVLTSLRDRLELVSDPYTTELYYWDIETSASIAFPLKFMGSVFLLHPLPDWVLKISHSPTGDGKCSYVRVTPPSTHAASVVERQRREKLQLKARRLEQYGMSPFASPDREGFGNDSVPPSPMTSLMSPMSPMTPLSPMGSSTMAALEVPFTINELATPPPGYFICTICGTDFARRQCHADDCGGHLFCWSCFVSYHPRQDERLLLHWAEGNSQRLYVKLAGEVSSGELQLMAGRALLPGHRKAKPLKRPEASADGSSPGGVSESLMPEDQESTSSGSDDDGSEGGEADDADDEPDAVGRQINDMARKANKLFNKLNFMKRKPPAKTSLSRKSSGLSESDEDSD